MTKALLCALTLIALPAFADNQRGFYVGGGVANLQDDQDEVTLSDTLVSGRTTSIIAGEIFGGYKYNGLLGAEVRVGTGGRVGTGKVYDATVTSSTTDGVTTSTTTINSTSSLERELGSYGSIYYKPEITNDEASLYALIGYSFLSTTGTITSTAGAVTTTRQHYSGLSYGLGVGFVVTDNVNLNIEYRNLCDDLYQSPNMASLSFDYRF
jgi:outer membrane autotransporter protein